ncbi:MAG: 4'-phosphopantetheinyl transferase family protein [Stackebrandtia sp.]
MTTATPTYVEAASGVLVAVDRADRVQDCAAVDPTERARADQMPAWRAAEYLGARGLLRRLLAEAGYGASGAILNRPSGQPYLPAHPRLGISLSHSDGLVAAAVGVDRRVGVDVQTPVPVGAALLERCCTPGGRFELAALPPQRRATEFAWIWTVQEACVKAAGAGLAGRPWRIPVEPRAREGRWSGYTWIALRDQTSTPTACAYLDAEQEADSV